MPFHYLQFNIVLVNVQTHLVYSRDGGIGDLVLISYDTDDLKVQYVIFKSASVLLTIAPLQSYLKIVHTKNEGSLMVLYRFARKGRVLL